MSHMTPSSTHPSFPARPPASTLGKLPDRTGGIAPFGSSTTQAHRDAQWQDRERERAEREGQKQLAELTEEQREEINDAFGLFDLDKDKQISYHELKCAMKGLGFELSNPEILKTLQTHGVPAAASTASNSMGAACGMEKTQIHPMRLRLSLNSFQAIMAQRILARDPQVEIWRAFKLFDRGGKGKVVEEDLKSVATELGVVLEDLELKAMIEEFDLDGDGAITWEVFEYIINA